MTASYDEQSDCDDTGDTNETDDSKGACDSTGVGKEARWGSANEIDRGSIYIPRGGSGLWRGGGSEGGCGEDDYR